MPYRDSDTLYNALTARMADLRPVLLRSITWDQETEMAGHLIITRSPGAPVYFCEPHSPWQRGSHENTTGLLRDYFPKGTELSARSPEHLLAVENELNNRPRKVLGDPGPSQTLRRAVSLCESVGVATSTRTRPCRSRYFSAAVDTARGRPMGGMHGQMAARSADLAQPCGPGALD